MYSVLFVCSANICRSPMAMGLLRELVKRDPDKWRIDSAGVWALVDHPVDQNVQSVLQERGIDVMNHLSKQVTRDLINDFNLVLTMQQSHREALIAAFPDHRSRIHLFSEMVGMIADIADPIGGSRSDFEATAQELEEIMTLGLERIKELADGDEGENESQ